MFRARALQSASCIRFSFKGDRFHCQSARPRAPHALDYLSKMIVFNARASQSASCIRFSFKSGSFHGLSAPERPAELLWLAARASTENSQLCCTASRYFTHRIALPLTGGPRQEAPRVLKTPLQPARQTDRHGNRQHLMVGSGQLQRFS